MTTAVPILPGPQLAALDDAYRQAVARKRLRTMLAAAAFFAVLVVAAAFLALLKPGDTFLGLDLSNGGLGAFIAVSIAVSPERAILAIIAGGITTDVLLADEGMGGYATLALATDSLIAKNPAAVKAFVEAGIKVAVVHGGGPQMTPEEQAAMEKMRADMAALQAERVARPDGEIKRRGDARPDHHAIDAGIAAGDAVAKAHRALIGGRLGRACAGGGACGFLGRVERI